MIDPQFWFKFEIHNGLALWQVPVDLPYFQGHFPNEPVMPGVAILDASEELICESQKKRIRVQKIELAKFVKPIRPGQNIQIILHRAQENQWVIDWKEPGQHGALLASLRLRT